MSSAAQWGDDGDAFEQIVGHLDYPMFVVTTVAGEQLGGCLVGFATQASIRPRRFLVGISDKNHTYRVAADADRLAVHVLAEGAVPRQLFGTILSLIARLRAPPTPA